MLETLLSNRTVSVLWEALPRILSAGLTMTIPLTLVSFTLAMDEGVRAEIILLSVLAVSILLMLRDRKSTRLNSSHYQQSRMPSSA